MPTAPTQQDVIDRPFAAAAQAAEVLAERTGRPGHQVAVVLGSGWTPAADQVGEITAEVALTDLGGPPPGVEGHGSTVRSISVGDRQVLAFLGRVHAYEGHPLELVVHGVRAAVAAGCTTVVLTNAAGGVRRGFSVGQPVLISDHLNLTGRSPLTGPTPPKPFARFPDLTDLYSRRLRDLARTVDSSLEEGVYAGLPGPHYETPAEITMLRTLGADLVGMSTVQEAIAARHMGATDILGMSLVTNPAAGMTGATLDHAEVLAAGAAAASQMGALLAEVIRLL